MDQDGAAQVLDGLNDEQREAVTSDSRHVCIIAGAGSGKTRVLTQRIAHRCTVGPFDPRRILALTFTRKAASELTQRLRRLGLRDEVAAGTFHGVAYAGLRARWQDQGRAQPELLDRKVGFVARLAERDRALEPIDLVTEIEWAKSRGVGPRGYADEVERQRRPPPLSAESVTRGYAAYEATKERRGLIDFDDLLLLYRRELEADADYGAAQRWRFRHLFVDEFQDTNKIQFAMLQALYDDDTDLCVVGDPRQAIYGWNGADPDYLESFAQLFTPTHTVELYRNYRSTPQILGVANLIATHSRPLTATRPGGTLPSVRSYADDKAEARGVARAARDAREPGRSWSDQAVLVRTNAQIPLLEEAFRKVGIPHRSRGGPTLLDRPEIKSLIGTLSLGHRLDAALADLAELDYHPPGEASGIEERRAAVAQFVRFGHDHLALDQGASVGGFLSWLRAATGPESGAGADDAVTLSTFHGAKGLEWPIVHVAGLEDGLAPIAHARTTTALNEERNLVYVALTRAERLLLCSWAERRTFGTRTSRRSPSPYLVDIDQALAAVEAGTAIDDPLPHLAAQQRALRARRGGPTIDLRDDDPVLVALKQWRHNTAHAADVPAFVVFDDATLQALASRRPTDRPGLLATPGMGRVKAARYGDALLDLLAGD